MEPDDQQAITGSHTVHLVVAGYRSRSGADDAFRRVRRADCAPHGAYVAGARLEKGASGELVVVQAFNPAAALWRSTLLGAALTVLAPPLGIKALADVPRSRAEWAGAVAVVGALWHDLPKQTLRVMGELLEEMQASLLVVTVDGHDVLDVVSATSTAIVVEGVDADVEADFVEASRQHQGAP